MTRAISAAVALLALSTGCGDAITVDAFAPHELGDPGGWGQGMDDYDPNGGGGGAGDGGTGGDGTGADAYDGTYEGTYEVSAYLADYGLTCACSAALTMVVGAGEIVVGFGESCTTVDCGIGTQLGFDGTVASDGSATGSTEEATSFFYTVPWAGAFDGSSGSGSFSEAGLATSQGTTDVTGSFSVVYVP